ncbi:MAG: hypothetical protein AABX65_03920 [Nanoarchaeota archaeon]
MKNYKKLLRLNQLVGKYVAIQMPRKKPVVPQQPPIPQANWFREASYIAPDHNSLEMAYVEEVFSRFLRQLA